MQSQTQKTAWDKYLDRKAIEFLASKQIIKSAPIHGGGGQAPGFIVLRQFGSQWATHFYNTQDGGFHHGHYFPNLDKAEADFTERVNRYRRSY